MTDNKVISGTYVVDKRFYDTVQLYDKKLDTYTTIDYFKFRNLLVQYFNADYIDKILEVLNNQEKLIIDFDTCKVKRIMQKEPNFMDTMRGYFNNAKTEVTNNADVNVLSADDWGKPLI